MNDEEQIRSLVEKWTEAVHSGDLDAVLADHSDDIVMFDVPPPYRGVRGIDEYRATWPDFFAWQRSGARFELTELEVTVGGDVAFAYGLLTCGRPEELAGRPGFQLRLTLGLVKRDDRWQVAHEHHSFPLPSAVDAENEVRTLHDRWFAGTATKDLDAMMENIAEDVVSYEHDVPLAYLGRPAVRAMCASGLDVDGEVAWDVPELTVRADGDLAVAWGLNRMTFPGDDGQLEAWSRGTRVFVRTEGDWQLVHQHLSYPSDPADGRSVTTLGPEDVRG